MRAAYLIAPRSIEVRDAPIPDPGPGEVVVRVTTALTCGTELKAYRQGHRLFKPPMALGHEFVGVVSAVGAGVATFRAGDRVVAANSAPCESCAECRAGRTNLCRNLPAHLLFGAFADFVRIPAPIVRHNLLALDRAVPDEVAAFVEPLACVVLGARAAAISRGERVLLVGGTGPIGLMWLQVAKALGGAVWCLGRNPDRLALATRLGAAGVLDGTAGMQSPGVAEAGQFDCVVEITGIPAMISDALGAVRPGGRLIVFGGSEPGATAPFDLARLHYEDLTVRGVFHHTPATVRESLALLSSGQVDVRPLVSARMPLEQTAEAMRRFDSGETMKLAIAPGARPPLVA